MYQVDDGAGKLAAGAVLLSAALTPSETGTAENNPADGATRLHEGTGELQAGAGKLTAGFTTLSGKLNSQDPANPGVALGTRLLADGTARIRLGMDGVPGNPDRPGLLKATASMSEGSARLATGTAALNAGIKGDPVDPANPVLLSGSEALAAGASELPEGNTKLASGSTQLATGAARLAEGNPKVAAGTETLHSSAAAVSPSNLVDRTDAGTAVGMVGVLGLGSVGAFMAPRHRRRVTVPQAEDW
ncbi:hypothetical protein [Arthrobacter oryzae]|uniref:hypothetical protein n=1 Tax=Arthrobacter oryzae TaxID=409290 RepID=UPI0030C8DA0F